MRKQARTSFIAWKTTACKNSVEHKEEPSQQPCHPSSIAVLAAGSSQPSLCMCGCRGVHMSSQPLCMIMHALAGP